MSDSISLSPRGEQRRDQMRTLLVGAVRQRRRRRLHRRLAVAALLLGGATWLCWPATPGMPTRSTTNVASAKPPAPEVQLLGNDPTVLARCTVAARPTSVQFLDDDTLVVQLRHAGRHAALARSADRFVLSGDAADDWTAEP